MSNVTSLTIREQSVWDATYAVAYIIYQDCLKAVVAADSCILDLRIFEHDHPERALPATQIIK